jgi:hypothetical protein
MFQLTAALPGRAVQPGAQPGGRTPLRRQSEAQPGDRKTHCRKFGRPGAPGQVYRKKSPPGRPQIATGPGLGYVLVRSTRGLV